MMRIALVFAAVLSAHTPLLVMGAPRANACSCAGFPRDEAGIRSTLEAPGWGDAVFAIGVTETRSEQDQSTAEATVRIERVYRGRIAERVEIRGEGLGGSCDYVPPEVGSRDFLILTEREGGKYAASLCGSMYLGTGTGPSGQAFIEALGRVSAGAPPDVNPPQDPPTAESEEGGDTVTRTRVLVAAAGVAGAMLAVAAAVLAVRARTATAGG